MQLLNTFQWRFTNENKSISTNGYITYLFTESLIISGNVLTAIANLKACNSHGWASQSVQISWDRVGLWKLNTEGEATVTTNIATLLLTY